MNADIELDGLTDKAKALLARHNVNTVQVAQKTLASDAQVADVQGQILPFMAEQGVSAMLVRPDFYIYGGASTIHELEELIGDFDRDRSRYFG